jgi:hypothetical protein
MVAPATSGVKGDFIGEVLGNVLVQSAGYLLVLDRLVKIQQLILNAELFDSQLLPTSVGNLFGPHFHLFPLASF